MGEEELDFRGAYDLGFFHLNVNTSEDIFKLDELYRDCSPEKIQIFSTFLHEYIHFLQEVTTISGVHMVGLIINFIKDVNNDILSDGKATFQVPYTFSNSFNSKTNQALIAIYRGNSDPVDYAMYDHFKAKEMPMVDRNGNRITPAAHYIYYYTKGIELKRYHFGFVCLKEFVTHTLQKKFYPGAEHPDLPYCIVKQIITKECPSFGSDIMHMVALCDACLMDIDPARRFFRNIERIRQKGFKPNSIPEVYNFVYNDNHLGLSGRNLTLRDAYQRGSEFTRDQISDALKSSIFEPNREWVHYILEQAQRIRFQRPFFMTDLVKGPRQLTGQFFRIIRRFGTPFFSDSKFNGGFVPPNFRQFKDVQAYQLLVFKQVLAVFNGSHACGLYEFCKKRPDRDITNTSCKTAPWLRGLEDDLCPFGQIWKTWGLNGEIPVRGV